MSRPIKTHATRPEHEAFRLELLAVIERYPQLPAQDLLAVASQLVGQLVAMQDRRKMSPEDAMAVVAANIESANAAVINALVPRGKA